MNKVVLIGNITKDFELQKTTNGLPYARFQIAIKRKFTNENGERDSDFITIAVWRTIAENCAKYLHKGDKIAVNGQIQTRLYEVNGEKKYAIEVVADEIEFLNLKGKNKSDDIPQELTKIENEDDLPF